MALSQAITGLRAPLRSAYRDLTAFIDYTVKPTLTTGNGDVPKVMYPLIIQSRLAAKRSWTEFWEIALRDPLGAFMWLWGIPLGQRLYIAKLVAPELRELLIKRPTAKALPANAGMWAKFKAGVQQLPLFWDLQPSASVKHRLDLLKQQQARLKNPQVLTQAITLLEKAKVQRDLATFMGFLLTFAVLGVGINIYNIRSTRKTIQAQKARFNTTT
jgi:hypothetical protein